MKFTKKLKSIRAAGEYLNQDRILSEFLPNISNHVSHIKAASSIWRGDDQNVPPPVNQINPKSAVLCGRKSSFGFRRPDLNSNTLFDPKLLEEFFELAAFCFTSINDEQNDIIVFPAHKDDNALHPPMPIQEDENVHAQQSEGFLPPEESVVFYTTTLRGIRKTFDDCNMVRFLLDSFKVTYYERDISMHRQYKEELRKETEVILPPPLLFIKGRCFGGAESVLCLHEQGMLRPLFDGIPIAGDKPCCRCDGMRFLICDKCRGSCRIVSDDGSRIQCLSCNENGLIVCLHCSS